MMVWVVQHNAMEPVVLLKPSYVVFVVENLGNSEKFLKMHFSRLRIKGKEKKISVYDLKHDLRGVLLHFAMQKLSYRRTVLTAVKRVTILRARIFSINLSRI